MNFEGIKRIRKMFGSDFTTFKIHKVYCIPTKFIFYYSRKLFQFLDEKTSFCIFEGLNCLQNGSTEKMYVCVHFNSGLAFVILLHKFIKNFEFTVYILCVQILFEYHHIRTNFPMHCLAIYSFCVALVTTTLWNTDFCGQDFFCCA